MLTTKPEKIHFIDRVLADSRQVAEAHVAGLSTPQQTLMALFAASDILDKDYTYRQTLDEVLLKRMNNLTRPLKYQVPESDLNSNYYLVIDLIKAAVNITSDQKFAEYLKNNRDPLEFLLKLAKQYGTVLLPAVGFAGPFWSARASLANLNDEDYTYIGEDLRDLIEKYYKEFKKSKSKRTKHE
jgi:aspartate 4-decarboxylase